MGRQGFRKALPFSARHSDDRLVGPSIQFDRAQNGGAEILENFEFENLGCGPPDIAMAWRSTAFRQ